MSSTITAGSSSNNNATVCRNPVAAAAATISKPEVLHFDLRTTSLHTLCQHTIVNRLERYPPEAFLCLTDLDDYESLIRLKHCKTKPKEGSGGLDGTGRVAPAVKQDYIAEVEAACPHLAHSRVVDELVWKDCVEFRFKRGGMTRPRALHWPWPLLVEHIREAGQDLLQAASLDDAKALVCIETLETSPMNVSLLQATAIGKIIKNVLKRHGSSKATPAYQKLAVLLTEWKDLAARNGVGGQGSSSNMLSTLQHDYNHDADDLRLAETCQTWRQLFCVLKHKEDERRSNLGKEMRERRKHLASDRPRIVKVRPTIAKREQMLARAASTSSSGSQLHSTPQKSKISQLRKESFQVASRTRPTAAATVASRPVSGAAPKTGGSFGAAVAFAASFKKNSSGKDRTKGSYVHLQGGKSMKVPENVAKKNAMARKWKSTK